MATTTAERPAVEQPRGSRWPRRIRVGALVVVATTILVLIQGNLALIAASWWARNDTELHPGPKLDGVRKLYVVDDRLWRGAQPGDKGFRSLAESGVTTVVDLRPSSDARRTDDDLRALGVESVHMAVTDGQPPSPEQVHDLVRIVARSTGRVFLHCGEGVGRAGTMSSAYKVTTGQASASDALRESLAIGVLTLEQIAFIRSLDRDGAHEPPAVLTALSRFLDGPRQLFNTVV
ncbi:MAG TPA: hypothetical protein VKE97_12390 [Acidimicrobiia bacterium]|nr:hypothetical protein [Acidimicrobiia bacterium]